jgi:hypothetical protein
VIDPRTLPVRLSRMKKMALSAQHYLAACQDDVDEPTLAMRFGTLGHALLWPDVAPPYAIYEGERRGAAWKEFEVANAHCEIYTRKEVDRASRLAESIDRHPDASKLVRLGEPERHIDWEYCGRAASSRLDVFGPSTVVELKTCRSAHPKWFVSDGIRMSYHAQVAFYRMAVAHLTGRALQDIDVVIVAVESARPHVVTVFELEDADLIEGEKLCRSWIERILVCEAANHWPGYVETRVPFRVPNPDEAQHLFEDDEDESEAA